MTEPTSPIGLATGSGWLQKFAGVAGLASAGLAALIVIYRDILAASWLSNLTSEHSAIIVGLVVLATFFVSVLAIFAWLAKHPDPAISGRTLVYLALVACFLGAILAVVWRVVPPPAPQAVSSLELGIRAYQSAEYVNALGYLEKARLAAPQDPEPLVWQARSNMQIGQWILAEKLLDRGLALNPDHTGARIEKLVIQLVQSGNVYEEDVLGQLEPFSNPATNWIACLKHNGFLNENFLTLAEIYSTCPSDKRLFS